MPFVTSSVLAPSSNALVFVFVFDLLWVPPFARHPEACDKTNPQPLPSNAVSVTVFPGSLPESMVPEAKFTGSWIGGPGGSQQGKLNNKTLQLAQVNVAFVRCLKLW